MKFPLLSIILIIFRNFAFCLTKQAGFNFRLVYIVQAYTKVASTHNQYAFSLGIPSQKTINPIFVRKLMILLDTHQLISA